MTRHERDHETRVKPAAQHRAERHVAHQPEAHRFIELLQQLRLPTLRGPALVWRRVRVLPIALDAHTVLVRDQRRARRELGYPGEGCARAGNVSERQVGVDRLVVESWLDETACE